MNHFFVELKKRNNLLFWNGLLQIVISVFCMGFAIIEHSSILGANAFFKPLKYCFTTGLITWGFAWILNKLYSKKSIKILSVIHFFTTSVITSIILLQSFRGEPSHFNTSTPFDSMLNSILWLMYIVYTIMIGATTFMFFNQKKMPTSQHFAWGIRLSLLTYFIFLFVGFNMMINKSHLISGVDSEKGLNFLNWNSKHGDLRIIHFIGIFSFPVISMASYYVFKKKIQIIWFALTYIILGLILYLLTMLDIPLIPNF